VLDAKRAEIWLVYFAEPNLPAARREAELREIAQRGNAAKPAMIARGTVLRFSSERHGSREISALFDAQRPRRLGVSNGV
jgi:hypothetical protein